MSEKYIVNINISAGVDFHQLYYLTDPDLSPKNITGFKFSGNIAKHSRAVHATTSTSEVPDWNYASFKCYVEDGVNGVFSLNMSSEDTWKLKEGKYDYSVGMKDANGFWGEPVSGLAFVSQAFGVLPPKYPGRIFLSLTPPPDKEQGSLWYNYGAGRVYIWQDNAWVDLTTQPVDTEIYYGPTPPPNPPKNKIWSNTTTNKVYIWFWDGDSYAWTDATIIS